MIIGLNNRRAAAANMFTAANLTDGDVDAVAKEALPSVAMA
jgi:hypothetical protein